MRPASNARGQDAAVADAAIVRDVRIDHEIVMVADASLPRMRGAAVDGDVLAEHVEIADFNARVFIVVFEMLRPFAQDSACVNLVALAKRQRSAK